MVFYRWFPVDYAGDALVQAMTDDQDLAYRRMLDKSWQLGPLPGDPSELALLVGFSQDRFVEAWSFPLTECWHQNGGGKLVNHRLESEREKVLERSEKARNAVRLREQKKSRRYRGPDDPEARVRASWMKLFPGADKEVKTPSGKRCDLVYGGWVFEFKEMKNWRKAVPQLREYATELERSPALILFTRRPPNMQKVQAISNLVPSDFYLLFGFPDGYEQAELNQIIADFGAEKPIFKRVIPLQVSCEIIERSSNDDPSKAKAKAKAKAKEGEGEGEPPPPPDIRFNRELRAFEGDDLPELHDEVMSRYTEEFGAAWIQRIGQKLVDWRMDHAEKKYSSEKMHILRWFRSHADDERKEQSGEAGSAAMAEAMVGAREGDEP